MNVRNWFSDLLSSQCRSALPIMTHPGIELIGKSVKDAVSNGDVHYEAIKALGEKFTKSPAYTTIMDLTVEAEAFGASIIIPEDDVPTVTGRLLSSQVDVEHMKIPSVSEGRLREYLKADRLAAANLPKPVFSGCIGPFSLAGRLYDMTEIMMAIYIEPDTIKLLLEKCTEFLLNYCKAIKETGVAGVIMAEPAAGLLSDNDCKEFSSVYIKRIISEVQDDTFAIILHNCGNTGNCTQAMFDTEAMAYHFGNQIDILKVLENACDDKIIMGNIDPVGVLKMGTPEEVYKVTSDLIYSTGRFRNFIISTGCDVPPNVPIDNIEAFWSLF